MFLCCFDGGNMESKKTYEFKSSQIADNVHNSITLTEIEQEIMSNSIFNRLHNVYQMSTIYYVYPSCQVRRFEHSLGTMEMCSRLFVSSVSNSDSSTLDTFFQNAKDELITIANAICNDSSRYMDKLGDKFDQLQNFDLSCYIDPVLEKITPGNVKTEHKNIFTILLQSIRLAGLMHDIGHPPYSHIVENAIMIIADQIRDPDIRNEKEKHFMDIYNHYYSGENINPLHEQIGKKLTEKCFSGIIDVLPKKCSKESLHKQSLKIVLSLFVQKIYDEENKFFSFLHSFVSGPIDGDRLDYLVRCAKSAGLSCDKINYFRIMASLKIIRLKMDEFVLGINEKYLSTIEDFFEEYRDHYNKLIFHHKCVKIDFMLQTCIVEMANHYFSHDYPKQMNTKIIPCDISGLWEAIRNEPSLEEFANNIIQWDDNWLMVTLRNFYLTYKESGPESQLIKKLKELLCNEKNYYSLIKRKTDFCSIDTELKKKLMKEREKLVQVLDRLNGANEIKSSDGIPINKDHFVTNYKEIIDNLEPDKDSKGLSVSIISKPHFGMDFFREEMDNKKVDLLSALREIECDDIVFIDMKKKNGMQDLCEKIKWYNKVSVSSFNDLSKLGQAIEIKEQDKGYFIYFTSNKSKFNYSDIKEKISSYFVESVSNRLTSFTENGKI